MKVARDFFNQSQSEVKQNQSKTRITFDTQLKTALIDKLTDFEPEGPGMHFCQNLVRTLGKGEGGLP